jgi:hypothetical protein
MTKYKLEYIWLDGYQIASQILKTVASVPTAGKVSAAA